MLSLLNMLIDKLTSLYVSGIFLGYSVLKFLECTVKKLSKIKLYITTKSERSMTGSRSAIVNPYNDPRNTRQSYQYQSKSSNNSYPPKLEDVIRDLTKLQNRVAILRQDNPCLMNDI